jgi:hypothetical protein
MNNLSTLSYPQLIKKAKSLGIKTTRKKAPQIKSEIHRKRYPHTVKLNQIFENNGTYWKVTRLIPTDSRSYGNGGTFDATQCDRNGTIILDRWDNPNIEPFWEWEMK